MYCTNKEEVKLCIRQGGMAHGLQAIGKTAGILEIIHEDHQGAAVLMVPLATLARIVRSRYKETFPDDVMPIFCTPLTLERAVAGTNVPVYVDTFDLVGDDARELVHRILRGRVIGAW